MMTLTSGMIMDGLVCVVKRFFKEFARCVESPIALQICPGGWVKVCRGLARVSDGLVPVDVEIRFFGGIFRGLGAPECDKDWLVLWRDEENDQGEYQTLRFATTSSFSARRIVGTLWSGSW